MRGWVVAGVCAGVLALLSTRVDARAVVILLHSFITTSTHKDIHHLRQFFVTTYTVVCTHYRRCFGGSSGAEVRIHAATCRAPALVRDLVTDAVQRCVTSGRYVYPGHMHASWQHCQSSAT